MGMLVLGIDRRIPLGAVTVFLGLGTTADGWPIGPRDLNGEVCGDVASFEVAGRALKLGSPANGARGEGMSCTAEGSVAYSHL